ncbi:MAG: hypothetical protein [Bacteriophage sp.]|nr:MAG: hypothetical protein [Bacteriophage sp.]
MAGYLAMRIMKGALDYSEVVKKFPQFKEDIDAILIMEGRGDLIVRE